MTPQWKYVILQSGDQLEFVEMPHEYAYQLSALILRLRKEMDKLTAGNAPRLPMVVAECEGLELLDEHCKKTGGLDYINRLEQTYASIQETNYPLIALLTEIRALQAQLEQWYEEEAGQE